MKLAILLLLLYFLQGVPYGFQTKFLPVFLRSYSLSLTLISFTRLLSLPWLLKPLWAPLVDKFGAKISWVKYNLLGMAFCYLIASCMSLSNVSLAVLVVACLNIMAATQDIAVDSLFVDNLAPEDIGLGNIAQVVGYKTGALFGGGVLGWLSSWYPWQQLFLLLFAIYIFSALLCSPFFLNAMFPQLIQPNSRRIIGSANTVNIDRVQNSKHVQSEPTCIKNSETGKNMAVIKSNESSTSDSTILTKRKKFKDDAQNKSAPNKDLELHGQKFAHLTYLDIYKNVLKSEDTMWMIVYVLIYKLGEQGMIAILPMFLLDQGVSSSDTAMLSGVVCQCCSILGSLLGGLMSSHWDGLRRTLVVLSSVRFLATSVLTWLGSSCSFNTNWIWFVMSDSVLHVISGMITTLTFTLMVLCSQKCPRVLSATHYSTLATFEVLGKLCMMSISGTIVDAVGYGKFFITCTVLTLLPVILLGTANMSYQKRKEVLD